MPNRPMFNRLEAILYAVLFPLAIAGEITFTVNFNKNHDKIERQYKLNHPKAFATYTVQPGDSLSGIYGKWAKEDIPDKNDWISKVLEYNPDLGLKEHGPLEPGTDIRLFWY